jgi:Ca2+-transporting ATPase
MQRRPRSRQSGIFTRPVVTLIAVGGAWSGIATLGLFTWALWAGRELEEAMTMTFVTLVLIEFFKAYSFRSDRASVLSRPFANRWLNLAILWELVLVLLVVNVPFLQDAFSTQSLSLETWLLVSGIAFTIVPVLEVAKRTIRRRGATEAATTGQG